ncbi:MAG: nicotinate-nucleotide adenylyltransferase [Gammaproteobacteria bacterium]|nr:nicotinate-nucleotide adenylyltransferase [Gammaproteobacteria bacterium]
MINQDYPSTEPLALFGGTFDPVHYGHLRCADEAREKLGLKNLYLLPAGTPPHRASPQTTTRQRLDMLQLAQTEFPALKIDQRETRREGPSYMVETLQELRAEFPQRPLLLLIGQDAANLLHTWFHWQQLFSLTHIVILTRPSIKVEYQQDVTEQIQRRLYVDAQKLLHSQADGVLQLEVTSIDVSATNIKKLISQGRSLHSMMPAAVIDYINKNHLYLPA